MRQQQASTSLGKSRKRYRRKKQAFKLAITPTQARSQAKARQSLISGQRALKTAR